MATTASKQKAKSAHGRTHKPDLTKTYRYRYPDIDLASQRFRATMLRRDIKNGTINVDGITTALEWRSEPGSPVLVGSLTLMEPKAGGPVHIHEGHVLRLEVYWGGKWRELWRMRLDNGQRTLSGGWTFDLADDMQILQENIDNWHFTKSKKHPKGWRCHEVLREVCRRFRVPVGKVAAGKHFITDISGEMSALQVIQKAYAIERRGSGKRFVMRWQNGKLNVLPMRRNDLLYILNDMIIDATIGKEERDEKFATAVTIRATVKKSGSKKRKKIVYKYVNEAAVKKEGFVHKTLGGGDVKSVADAEKKAKRHIAKYSVRKRTITGLQHQGIAFIRRGDAMRVSLPQYGFSGKHGVCFVTSGTWSLSGGQFTMALDFTFDDPWPTAKQKRKDKDSKTRKDKREKRTVDTLTAT